MIKLTEEQFVQLRNESGGVCRACKAAQHGVEPDARHYMCESCEKNEVFGVEELLVMGEVQIVNRSEIDRRSEQQKRIDRKVEDFKRGVKLIIETTPIVDPKTEERYRRLFEEGLTKTEIKAQELKMKWKKEIED